MSHTKGPWRIRVNKNDDQDTCDMSICGDIFVLADINGPQYPHQKANACLIAAAPDLLEFVQQIFNGIDTGMITIDTPADETLANVLSRGRKALSKATGVI